MAGVALDVALQFRDPIFGSGAGNPPVPAIGMLVPKAPVNEDDAFPTAERKIGLAGQVLDVESVPISELRDEPPDDEFRSCVLAPNSTHVLGAAALVQAVQGILSVGLKVNGSLLRLCWGRHLL